jgi:uncharacterized Fe-S center protein
MDQSTNQSKVYFTKEINSQGIFRVLERLSARLQAPVSLKISTGEKGNQNYLRPELLKPIVDQFNATIVECNTAYGGARDKTADHLEVVKEHGFDQIAKVDIMDANGEIELPVPAVNGEPKNIAFDVVGKNFANYNSFLVISHFKGHIAGGFGGALKNISIGIASSRGKLWIHNAGHGDQEWMSDAREQDEFLESMAEAASAVLAAKGPENFAFVNVLNNISVDCDCDGNAKAPDMHDIGILASSDPVALDRASVDLVYQAPDSASVQERIESRNGTHTLDFAASLKLGNLNYELINID